MESGACGGISCKTSVPPRSKQHAPPPRQAITACVCAPPAAACVCAPTCRIMNMPLKTRAAWLKPSSAEEGTQKKPAHAPAHSRSLRGRWGGGSQHAAYPARGQTLGCTFAAGTRLGAHAGTTPFRALEGPPAGVDGQAPVGLARHAQQQQHVEGEEAKGAKAAGAGREVQRCIGTCRRAGGVLQRGLPHAARSMTTGRGCTARLIASTACWPRQARLGGSVSVRHCSRAGGGPEGCVSAANRAHLLPPLLLPLPTSNTATAHVQRAGLPHSAGRNLAHRRCSPSAPSRPQWCRQSRENR